MPHSLQLVYMGEGCAACKGVQGNRVHLLRAAERHSQVGPSRVKLGEELPKHDRPLAPLNHHDEIDVADRVVTNDEAMLCKGEVGSGLHRNRQLLYTIVQVTYEDSQPD